MYFIAEDDLQLSFDSHFGRSKHGRAAEMNPEPKGPLRVLGLGFRV